MTEKAFCVSMLLIASGLAALALRAWLGAI